jgi:hypothetical protein
MGESLVLSDGSGTPHVGATLIPIITPVGPACVSSRGLMHDFHPAGCDTYAANSTLSRSFHSELFSFSYLIFSTHV